MFHYTRELAGGLLGLAKMGKIVFGDNLAVLRGLADGSFDLIYIDPPFNTGKRQERERIKTVHDETNGDRTGFTGRRYQTIRLAPTNPELVGSDAYAES